MEIILKLVSDS